MARQTTVVRSASAQATTGQTDVVTIPGFATNMILFVNVTATPGTTNLTDFKLQYLDPVAGSGTALDVPGTGITQIVETTTAFVVVQVGPGVTGIADDDTTAVYSINMVLPSELLFVTTLDRGDGNETYTYTITAQFSD